MTPNLNATTQSSGQSTTQSPQTAVGSASTAQSSNVQPGTADNLLRSSQGIPLVNTAANTVNFGAVSTQATLAVPTHNKAASHHINPALVGFSGLLILIAFVLFWTAERSVKSTT